MNKHEPLINNIVNKINQILDKYIDLEQRYIRLKEDNQQLRNEIDSYKEQKTVLENKLKFIKMSKGVDMNEEENKVIKHKINEYIREIDKCIGMLND